MLLKAAIFVLASDFINMIVEEGSKHFAAVSLEFPNNV